MSRPRRCGISAASDESDLRNAFLQMMNFAAAALEKRNTGKSRGSNRRRQRCCKNETGREASNEIQSAADPVTIH